MIRPRGGRFSLLRGTILVQEKSGRKKNLPYRSHERPSMRNYYEILDVPQDATTGEIRTAYRFHLKAFHPDKFASGTDHARNAQRRTEEIIEAYGVLSKPHFRAEYDRFRKYTAPAGEAPLPHSPAIPQDNLLTRIWGLRPKTSRFPKMPMGHVTRVVVVVALIGVAVWVTRKRQLENGIISPTTMGATTPIPADPPPLAITSSATASGGIIEESGAEAAARGDFLKAARLFQEAADEGDMRAQENLASFYETGQGVSRDDQKAFALYEKATAQGSVEASLGLGRLYYQGRGVKRDYGKAAELFDKAAGKGSAEAMARLGWLFAQGQGVQQDYNVALAQYERARSNGYTFASTLLGLLYELAQGVPRDYKKAAELYQEAAELGDLLAITNLANLYAAGRGVTQDYVKAVDLLEKAVFQNDPRAQVNLGWFYAEGKGVAKDEGRALQLYQAAVDQNYAPAQSYLAQLYARGDGVSLDYQRALDLYRKAAAQDDPDAFNGLAWILATCPDSGNRDGKNAVSYALKGCEMTLWTDANVIGTLAAAYAESGDFDKAVKYARHSLKMTSLTASQRREMEHCLNLFKQHRPYRDENRFDAFVRSNQVTSTGASEARRLKAEASSGTADALNDLAWFLATYPEATQRDGKQAITHALKACEISKWGDSHFISTLAAAYAETGQFDKAVRFATEALAVEKRISGSGAANFRQRTQMQGNLELYEKKQPYRQEVRTSQVISR